MFQITGEARMAFGMQFDTYSNKPLKDRILDDVVIARQRCMELGGDSIVLVKNGTIRAEVSGVSDIPAACTEAGELMHATYRSRHWIVPWQDVVAAIGFAPTSGIHVLAGYGVDVIYARKRPPAMIRDRVTDKPYPGKEDEVVAEWLKLRIKEREQELRGLVFDHVNLLGPKPEK
jgi:hypothetical protein